MIEMPLGWLRSFYHPALIMIGLEDSNPSAAAMMRWCGRDAELAKIKWYFPIVTRSSHSLAFENVVHVYPERLYDELWFRQASQRNQMATRTVSWPLLMAANIVSQCGLYFLQKCYEINKSQRCIQSHLTTCLLSTLLDDSIAPGLEWRQGSSWYHHETVTSDGAGTRST